MTWRDDLRQVKLADGRKLIGASFRGVPFLVEESDRSGGRRVVVHKFPLRDDPYLEDLGRDQRDFRIEGYVLGDDYVAQRDKLLDALEAEGPGELVHPYHGVRIASCLKHSVRESIKDGGIAMFALEFTEAPTQTPTPSVTVDATAQVSDAADAASEASATELADSFDVEGMPAFSLASAEVALTNATAALKNKLSPIVSSIQELAELTASLDTMTAEAASLVRTPSELLSKFDGAVTALIDTAANVPAAMMRALFDAYDVDLGPTVVATTPTRTQELANQAALVAALRRVMIVEAARLAPTVAYATLEDALAARDKIVTLLDEQAGLAGDAAYPALVDLRSQVMNAVPGAATFASVVTVTRNEPIPSLALAYRLYGSVDLEGDIVTRNDIPNPGFVSGDLKVLSDG